MQTIIKYFLVFTLGVFIISIYITGINDVRAESYIKELEKTWIQPVDGTITDTFGTRNGKHKGIDIAAPDGVDIVTVSDGKVVKSYYSNTYGNVVFIQHPEGYETVYAHLAKRHVSEGDLVKKGQVIGIIGNTGVSTGTHLHFELHEGEWTFEKEHALDPLFVFDRDNSIAQSKNQNHINKHEQSQSVETNATSFSKNNLGNDIQKKEVDVQKRVITVVKGDTLWGLSNTFNVPIASIKKWNHLNGNVIYPNQELTVFLNNSKNYVVKPGDTIQSIAAEFSTSPEAIKKINDMTNETIHPQQVLVISKK